MKKSLLFAVTLVVPIMQTSLMLYGKRLRRISTWIALVVVESSTNQRDWKCMDILRFVVRVFQYNLITT